MRITDSIHFPVASSLLKMKQLILLLAFVLYSHHAFCQGEKLPLILERFDSTNDLVLLVTGDGGWKNYSVKLADELKVRHTSYMVLNSLKYFWERKTPDEFANELTPVIKAYLEKWNKKELVLMGLSFGADVTPFLYNRMPAELKLRIKQIVLISPASTSDFTIHLSDMMGEAHTYKYDVVKEVEKIKTTKIITFYGDNEKPTFPINHHQDNLQVNFLKGGHHFTDAATVIEKMIEGLNSFKTQKP